MTLKILISYIILGAIAIFVCLFLYQKLKQETPNSIFEEKEIINTSALISALYETDSYAALSLQSLKKDDYNIYVNKNDSLIASISALKNRNTFDIYGAQLDTIAMLLTKKKINIKQLRLIKISNNQDDALNAILDEFELLEINMSRMTLKNFIKNPDKLSDRQKKAVHEYTNYINSKKTKVSTSIIDTMLTSTREIVSSAKKSNVELREILLEKQNILVRNDLKISLQLRKIITSLSKAMDKKQKLELELKNEAINTSNRVVKIAGWTSIFLIILFSYFIISDFFKAQLLKNKLQEEQQKTNYILDSRERLIANVSHDLKTPLTTISGYTELLDKTNLSIEQLKYTNAIKENAQYINHLAQDLLNFSKLEANKINIVKAPFNLYRLLQKIMNDAIVLKSKDSVSGILALDDELKGMYFIHDALRIEQVITNLISNAFKFTETGEIKIKAILNKQTINLASVIISISDTGIGIKKEKQKTIFNPFTQADDGIVQNYGGSGLGLAISKKLTELLKGTLTVESEVNQGSTFTFTIPIEAYHNIKTKTTTHSQLKKGIIIDDDIALLNLLRVLFQQLKVEVYCYASFTALQKNPPINYDFILTDMQMPNDTGLDILFKIKNNALKKYSNQPIYLMSGNLEFDEKEYLKKGFSGVIAKPFTIDNLSSLLNIKVIESLTTKEEVTLRNKRKYASFNPKALEEFLSDPESIRKIVVLFKKETKNNRDTLAQAIKIRDNELLQKTTHKMQTMTNQLEANSVAQGLESLQESSKLNNSPKQLNAIFKELKKNINSLLEDLTHYLHQ